MLKRRIVGVAKQCFKPKAVNGMRPYSQSLKDSLAKVIPVKQAEAADLRKNYGTFVLDTCTVDKTFTGMRDLKALVTETSLLDPQEGIRYRGYTLKECRTLLPKSKDGEEPLPEGILWLLMTGNIPTNTHIEELTTELHRRSEIPESILRLCLSFPSSLHPMTQLSMGIMALQQDSQFASAYHKGVHKKEYWSSCFEDALDVIAKTPRIAALIYRNLYRKGENPIIQPDTKLDWAANMRHMMGLKESKSINEMFRLYFTLHADHEGGNVSAHTTHLVGSALSDPYLSFAAGLNGLAGPLHGLASQEVLTFLKGIQKDLKGQEPTKENLSKICWDILNSGRVIPGYGHAVLRQTDPRYTYQREFALKHFPNDPLFKLVGTLYEIVPDILTKHGKTKNPYPNVDAHSGCLLQHFGIMEEDFYTCMFGVSRGIGVLSSLVWDRILGLAIERPKSETMDSIKKIIDKANAASHHDRHD